MIECNNNFILLETAQTSYAMYADASGNLLHLYYGPKIAIPAGAVSALLPRQTNPLGCTIIADPEQPNLSLDGVCLEISTQGKGDMRDPFLRIDYPDGSMTSDFRFTGAQILDEKPFPEGLPGAYSESSEACTTVKICLADRNSPLKLELFYTVFPDCDCITRFTRLVNAGDAPVTIQKLMSAQLDLPMSGIKVVHFSGDWTREMRPDHLTLRSGKFVIESRGGFSSNRANPFAMYAEHAATEEAGQCYATNLIYSGNHQESIEANSQGITRILTGIHPDSFSYTLEPGASFDTPEAVMTYSTCGYRGISRSMHRFVREHIVRGWWKKRSRPILLNSWEAMYFGVQEKKVLRLAQAAKKAGIELFVLDDGWFGKRDDDTSSLGDWNDNLTKLPGGLAALSEKIRKMGMMFGIWVEPEMVNENSELYKAHPDWAVRNPRTSHSLGRNQMLLDLTQTQVQDYIIETMSDVFSRSQADYVKWDMNRNFSDYFSQASSDQGAFSFRYIAGLYRVLRVLTEKFPKILFEGCASGGNRFDLGMLCFMPQIWASDCTDAYQRGIIQSGYSYGYPQSVIGAHVSASPNHQTLRPMPLESRFAIASAGVLGYECNLCDASPEDLAAIAEQIALYKTWRKTMQFGQFYRLNGSIAAGWEKPQDPFDTDHVRWMIVSADQSQAVGIVMQDRNMPNYAVRRFQTVGLKDEALYRFTNRSLKYDIRLMGDLINTVAPAHIRQDSALHHAIAKFYKLDGETEDYTLPGSLLNHAGVNLAAGFAGTGMGSNTAIYRDNDAKIFFFRETENPTTPLLPKQGG